MSPIRDRSANPKTKLSEVKHISKWNIEATVQWLASIGYEDCGQYFKEHHINGIALLMLDENDLKEVIKHNVGQRKNLYHEIRLKQVQYNRYMNKKSSDSFFNSNTDDEDSSDQSSDDEILTKKLDNNIKKSFLLSPKPGDVNYDENWNEKTTANLNSSHKNNIIHRHLINESENELNSSRLGTPAHTPRMTKKNTRLFSEDKYDTNMPNFCENCLKKFDSSPYANFSRPGESIPIRCYKGEKRKTLASMVYLFLIGLWSSFMLTVVHDRVPDMQKYPPLPDIILDNVPLITWAFFASEAIGIVLLTILFLILFFHKYRLIIFRRMCSLSGTIFFLRSITMLITSLSVPGIHIQCSSEAYGSFTNKLQGAWNILTGGGLYTSGVRTCGDYMFSGHTVWLTLTTHFISEYTPPSMYWLHTGSWVMNIFGLFFILGSHEHYSIDVFVGFYITSRLFLYYHSLANNKALFQRDHKRVKIWFPLLSYFESNIHSIVPNEFQYPPNFIYYSYKFTKSKLKQIKKVFIKQKTTNAQDDKPHDQ